MEKKATNMLTEGQKKRILEDIQKFLETASEFNKKESELRDCEESIKANTEKLSKVAEEERQIEVAMEVLYGEVKKEAETRKIKEEIETLQKNLETLNNELDHLRTSLLNQMHNLPIPVNLENPQNEETDIAFSFFEGGELGKEGINVVCKLFRQEPPLSFSDATFLPDKIVVKSATEKENAIAKLIEGIRSFRMQVDDLLKSYEQIDEMVERVRRSTLYYGVLRILFKKGKQSIDAIANALNMDERKAYDTCYNLKRSNWSPNPIRNTPSGEWELTLPGKILVNRLLQKYREANLEKNMMLEINGNKT